MIRYFETFAGIGAFRSAFEKVGGFECVGWCEIDKYAQKSYRALYDTGGESFYEDITKIDYGSMPDFDLLVGGPCCQSFSIAGNRRAFEDDRGNLFFEYIRILEIKRPRYFIAKNVPNLLGISQGECFRIILEKISELGYSICWRVLNASGFGIPQSRRRLFLIGYLGKRCPCKILAFGGNDEENSRKGKPEQLIGGSQGKRVYSTNGIAVTQCSGSGGMGGKTGLYFIDSNPPPTLTETARCLTTRQNSGISNHKGEHSAVFVEERPRAILNPFKENTRQNGRRIKNPDEPMFTLTVTDRHGIVHKGRIRRLMPVECWKLMGFEESQFEKVASMGMSDAQLYKQAGNSIVVPILVEIAKNLKKFDEDIKNEEQN